jgi:hypothetical protein
MAAILGECNSESNRTPCKVSVVSILLVQQRGNFRIVLGLYRTRERAGYAHEHGVVARVRYSRQPLPYRIMSG